MHKRLGAVAIFAAALAATAFTLTATAQDTDDVVPCWAGANVSGDAAVPLVRLFDQFAFGFIDDDEDAAWDVHERIYLDLDRSKSVTTIDVRLYGNALGSRPKATDVDMGYPITWLNFPLFYLDEDSDGLRDPTEAFLVSPSGRISIGDIYLGPLTVAGRIVTSEDPYLGSATASAGGRPAYQDLDNDGILDHGEPILWDETYPETGQGVADGGDYCFTSTLSEPPSGGSTYEHTPDPDGSLLSCTAGTNVEISGDAAVVRTPGAVFSYYDRDQDGALGPTEYMWLDLDATGTVTTVDVRLHPDLFGQRPGPAGHDDQLVLSPIGAPLAFVDDDADGKRDATEDVFLDVDRNGRVSVNDRYLAPADQAGSVVDASSIALNNPLTGLAALPAFEDLDGDAAPDATEPVILDMSSPSTKRGLADPLDLCLTGHSESTSTSPVETQETASPVSCMMGLTVLQAEHPVAALTTFAVQPTFGFIDSDGNGHYSNYEAFILDVDASGTLTTPDVRLSGDGAGTRPKAHEADFGTALTFTPATSITYLDDDADAMRDSTERVRMALHVGDPLHITGAIYLAPEDRAGGPPLVDEGWPSLGGGLAFVDADADGQVSAGETIVWDHFNDGNLNVGDICLSGAVQPNTATAGEDTSGQTQQGWTSPDLGVFTSGSDSAPPGGTGDQGGSSSGTDSGSVSAVSLGGFAASATEPKTVAIGTGAILAAVGAFVLRWQLLLHGPGLIALFSRLQRDKLLDHPFRSELYELVEADPGIHYQEIIRRTGRGRGVTEYHLERLVRGKLLRRHMVRNLTQYYLTAQGVPANAREQAALKAPRARMIAAELARGPISSSKELSQRLGIPPSSVHETIHRLAQDGVVAMERHGRGVTVRLTDAGQRALSCEC